MLAGPAAGPERAEQRRVPARLGLRQRAVERLGLAVSLQVAVEEHRALLVQHRRVRRQRAARVGELVGEDDADRRLRVLRLRQVVEAKGLARGHDVVGPAVVDDERRGRLALGLRQAALQVVGGAVGLELPEDLVDQRLVVGLAAVDLRLPVGDVGLRVGAGRRVVAGQPGRVEDLEVGALRDAGGSSRRDCGSGSRGCRRSASARSRDRSSRSSGRRRRCASAFRPGWSRGRASRRASSSGPAVPPASSTGRRRRRFR